MSNFQRNERTPTTSINKLFECGLKLQQEKKDLADSKIDAQEDIKKIIRGIDDVKDMIAENQRDIDKVQHQINQKEEYISELNIYLKKYKKELENGNFANA